MWKTAIKEEDSMKTEEGIEVSEKGVAWLKAHNLYSRAKNVEEGFGRLSFINVTEDKVVVMNEVWLNNGSWSFHTIRRRK